MTTLLIAFAAVWTIGLLALFSGLFRAPEGAQDDAGFHPTRQ